MEHLFRVPAGTTVRFGAPARPLPEDTRNNIRAGLACIPGVVEAHLPLCQAVGLMAQPAQILVVVLTEEGAGLQSAIRSVTELVQMTIPSGQQLDVWPFATNDPLLDIVRRANCCLFTR